MQAKRAFSWVVLLTTMTLFSAQAQVSVGAKITRNHTWQQYKDGTYDESANLTIWGFGSALTFDKQLSKYVSVSAELGWMQRGSKCMPDFIRTPPYSDAQLVVNYLSVPIFLKGHYPILKNRLLITAELGFSGAWMVSGQQILMPSDARIPVVKTKIDMKTQTTYNRMDYGLNTGVGLSLPIKNGFIDANFAYYYGLKDVYKIYVSKNRSIAYQLGYRFVL